MNSTPTFARIDALDARGALHPSLYPILAMLSRLRASAARAQREDDVTRVAPSDFIPIVRRCAAGRPYAVRAAAARALAPLVNPGAAATVVGDLLSELAPRRGSRGGGGPVVGYNAAHGALLCAREVVLAARGAGGGAEADGASAVANVAAEGLLRCSYLATGTPVAAVATEWLRCVEAVLSLADDADVSSSDVSSDVAASSSLAALLETARRSCDVAAGARRFVALSGGGRRAEAAARMGTSVSPGDATWCKVAARVAVTLATTTRWRERDGDESNESHDATSAALACLARTAPYEARAGAMKALRDLGGVDAVTAAGLDVPRMRTFLIDELLPVETRHSCARRALGLVAAWTEAASESQDNPTSAESCSGSGPSNGVSTSKSVASLEARRAAYARASAKLARSLATFATMPGAIARAHVRARGGEISPEREEDDAAARGVLLKILSDEVVREAAEGGDDESIADVEDAEDADVDESEDDEWRLVESIARRGAHERVRCAALACLGRLAAVRVARWEAAAKATGGIPPPAVASLTGLIAAGASPERPADVRRAAASALAASTLLSRLPPAKVSDETVGENNAPTLGEPILRAWLAAFTMMEDEDEDVRDVASRAATRADVGVPSDAQTEATLRVAFANVADRLARWPPFERFLFKTSSGPPVRASALRDAIAGVGVVRRLFDREADNHHAEALLLSQLAARALRRGGVARSSAAADAREAALRSAEEAAAALLLSTSAHASAATSSSATSDASSWAGGVTNHEAAFAPVCRACLALWALATDAPAPDAAIRDRARKLDDAFATRGVLGPMARAMWVAARGALGVEVAREEPDADVGGALESLDPCFLLD